MNDDIIQNKFSEPNLKEILNYMSDDAKNNFTKLSSFLEREYKASPVIMYSKCSAMPGWNVKYKKGSKSYCTIYPDKEFFTVLLILREIDINNISENKDKYSEYFLNIMNNSGAMNGCKWLMIGVDDSLIIDDIQRAIVLKNS